MLKKDLRVLVAEDNPINQKVIRFILGRAGIPFDVVENGDEALTKYKDGNYDLVLMDCQMPVVDGLEATQKIRTYEFESQLAKCPIVAMTANAMSGDRDRCLSVGMDDFLAKPFKNDELLKIVNLWRSQYDSKI